MSKEIVGKVKFEKGYNYRVTKEGDVIKEKYSWIKDRYTLVVILILILSITYVIEMKNSITNANNFDNYCVPYIELRNNFVYNNPGKEINFKNVLEYNQITKYDLLKMNLSNG